METWVLYAFSTSSGFGYHGTNREGRMLNLRDPQPTTVLPDYSSDSSVQTWTFGVDLTVPHDSDTSYLRTIYPVPTNLSSIIAHEVHVDKLQHVHHIVVYYCEPHWDPHFDNGDSTTGTRVYNEGHVHHEMFPGCSNFMQTWATGGQAVEVWPDDMALAIPDGVAFIQMEIHYDNPALIPGNQDRTNMTFYYIESERAISVGNALIGPAQSIMSIPPGESSFEWTAMIGSSCTSQLPHPIHVHHILPHMHTVGRGFKWRVIRNGVVVHHLEWLYDFNKQNYFESPNMTIMPEDILQVTCIYDTSGETEPVLGG